jgi:hypothetical protein
VVVDGEVLEASRRLAGEVLDVGGGVVVVAGSWTSSSTTVRALWRMFRPVISLMIAAACG